MEKNKRLSIILLIIGMLIGPLGTIMGIFGVGDKAFSGRNNVKSIDGYYFLDYLTISASYNLAIIIGLALFAWVIKSRKVKLSKILHSVLIGHLFFIPSFFVSLFLSVIPMEGNIKGFFIFPAFILTAIGGIIGFLIFFIIKLVRIKKENTSVLDIKPLRPYGVFIAILVFLNFSINNQSTTDVELVSFEHENFTWGIKQRGKTKAGMVKTSINDPYIVYIKHKNGDNESSNIKILKNYHSLYTKLDSIIPIQNKAIKYNNLNPTYTINYNENFEVINLNKNKSIYRLRKYSPSYTLCLSQSEANLKAMGIIAEDIKQNSITYDDLTTLIEGFVIEAIAINKQTIIKEKFLRSDGSSIEISENGDVKLKDVSIGEEYGLVFLGQIREGVYYSNAGTSNMDSFVNDTYKPVNYSNFKNSENLSLETVYPHINGRECATSIEIAIDKCPKIEYLYLVDQNRNKGILNSINKLSKLFGLNTKGINIGEVPESICELKSLNTINFNDSKTLTFPDCIGNLNSLYFIDVVNCNIKEVPKAFYNLIELRGLNLKGNNIIKLPKDLAQLKFLTDITLDFDPNLEIALEIFQEKSLRLELVVYNKKDKLNAEKFIEQYAKENEQLREQIYDSFIIDEDY